MGLAQLFKNDLNQTLTLERCVGKDYAGNILYEKEEIKARIDGSIKFIQDDKGNKRYSTQTYITLSAVNVGDKINGQFVYSVNILYDFNGDILHYEATV